LKPRFAQWPPSVAGIEVQKEQAKTNLKINEIAASSAAKINEIKSQPKGDSDAT